MKIGAADLNQKSFFQRPCKYRIKVHIRLDESRSSRMYGMRITGEGEDSYRRTILERDIWDQTQLSGMLNTLYDLHMTILLVELLKFTNHENDIS